MPCDGSNELTFPVAKLPCLKAKPNSAQPLWKPDDGFWLFFLPSVSSLSNFSIQSCLDRVKNCSHTIWNISECSVLLPWVSLSALQTDVNGNGDCQQQAPQSTLPTPVWPHYTAMGPHLSSMPAHFILPQMSISAINKSGRSEISVLFLAPQGSQCRASELLSLLHLLSLS